MEEEITIPADSGMLISNKPDSFDCKFCGNKGSSGITLHGVDEENYYPFEDVNLGDSAHMECWIRHMVKKAIRENLK